MDVLIYGGFSGDAVEGDVVKIDGKVSFGCIVHREDVFCVCLTHSLLLKQSCSMRDMTDSKLSLLTAQPYLASQFHAAQLASMRHAFRHWMLNCCNEGVR